MKDWNAVRHNERLKLFTQAFMGVGAALGGWAAVSLWGKQTFAHTDTVWLLLGIGIGASSIAMLGLMQPEE